MGNKVLIHWVSLSARRTRCGLAVAGAMAISLDRKGATCKNCRRPGKKPEGGRR